MLDLDLKQLLFFVKRNLVGFIVVFIFYAGIGWRLWEVHREQELQVGLLAEQRTSLSELKLAFEREKSEFHVEQARRELELQKREFLNERVMEKIAKQDLEFINKEGTLLQKSQKLEAERESLAREQASARMEEKIQKLMSEFSELGVNLDENPHCLSGKELMRYNVARNKFSQIYTLVKSNLLLGKYGYFIEQNKQRAEWYGCAR